MKLDRKTKAARNPAKSKTNNSKYRGNDIGKKPSRSVTRTKTAKGQLPRFDEEMRLMQEESIGSPQRLLATYEHAPVGIIENSLEGNYVNCNEEFCRITGYGKEELLTLGIKDLTYEEDYIFDIKLHQRLVAGEIPFYKLEKRYMRKDGKIIWAEVTRSLVRDADGAPLYTIGAVLDVSERKQAEEQLRRTVSFHKAVMSNMGEGLYTVDSNGLVTSMNSAAEKLFGRTFDELRGRKMHDVTHHKHSDGTPFSAEDCAGFQVLRSGQILVNFEDVFIRKDGTFFDVLYSSSPLWENGNINGLVVVFSEITERKRAEQELTEFARQQEALYKLADQLHRTNSLEDVFNAALNAILSALQCDRASILLFDDTGVMRFVAWRGLSESYRKVTEGHSPWKPDEKNPEPIGVNDIDTAELSDSLKAIIKEEGIGSLAFIPLVSNGKLIGKFMMYFNVPHVFGEGELELSLTIARQLAFGVDRKRSEEALRASEALYRAIARSIPGGGVYVVDKDLHYIVAEGPVTEAFGLSRETLEGHAVSEIFDEEIQTRMEECFQRAFAGETTSSETERNGHVYWSQYAPLVDSIGQAIVVTLDVTNQKQAENRLTLLAEISDFTRKLEDPNELLFAISKAIGEHLQVRRCLFNEIDLENDREIVHRDYCRGVESVAGMHKISDYSSVTSAEMEAGKTVINYDSKIDARTAQDYERVYELNGERAYVAVPMMRENRWVASLWVSDDKPREWSKEEVSLLEIVAERTWTAIEKLRIDAALRTSEERYRNLFDLVPVAVYSCDADGLIQEYNHRAVELWGREPHKNDPNEKYCGSFKIYHPDGRFMPHEKCPMARMLRGETLEPHELEILVERPDGLRRNVIAHPLPLKNEHGEIIAAINCLYDITKRKQAEEKIIFQANLLGAVGSAVIATDLNGIMMYWNPAAEKLYGWSSSDALGKNVVEVAPAPQSQEHAGEIMKQLATGKSWSGDFLVQRKDGSTFPAFVSDSPILDTNGKLVGIIGVSSDITELKQAEEALQQLNLQLESRVQSRTEKLNNVIEALRAEISERKRAEAQLVYQAQLIDNVNDAIIATDENLLITYWNQTAEQIYGWKAEEAIGRSASAVLQSEFMDGNTRSEALQKVNESGDLRTAVTHLRKDGARIFIEAHTSTLRNEEGKTIGYISINRDVTERKQAEELLRRWAHIFEHADWGIATIRQDTFMMVNPTYTQMHGYTGEELVGRSIYDVFAPESHADLREQIRIAHENGHHIYESKHIRRDGSIFPVLVDTTVVRDKAGNVLYRAVNVQDITERKRVEQELHESRDRLRSLSQRLVEVQEEERRAIARELHDRVGQTLAALNINLIIMNGQLLEDSKQRIGSRMADSMHLVAEAIALVRNVMTDLRPAVLDDYGLEAALQSYIDEYKSRYNIKVVLAPPDQPIPRLGPSLEMTLLRITQEALFNIARHAQADLVNVSLRLQDNAVHLMVQDNGVGIQSWQDANRPGSHGLTIMRERADAFGGSLNVGSGPGMGTKVDVSIPLQNGSHKEVREEKR